MSLKLFLILLLILFLSRTSLARSQETVKVAAISWCPQVCTEGDNEGYIVDILREIYSSVEYELDIQYFPWSRALKLVREGQFHILLSPAKAEAPNLTYPDHAVGKQQMCFFIAKERNWKYQGPKSLAGLAIGIAQDTSIEELNEFKKYHREQFQYQPYLNRFVKQNAIKLKKGRIDTFLFTRHTTIWELSRLGMVDDFKVAGCVSEEDIYVAFSSDNSIRDVVSRLSKKFDEEIVRIRASEKLNQIMVRYF